MNVMSNLAVIYIDCRSNQRLGHNNKHSKARLAFPGRHEASSVWPIQSESRENQTGKPLRQPWQLYSYG